MTDEELVRESLAMEIWRAKLPILSGWTLPYMRILAEGLLPIFAAREAEKRQVCGDRMGDMSCTLIKGHKGRHIDERVFGDVKPSYADLAARLADAEARAEAAVTEAINRARTEHWQKHLREHPYADAKSCPGDYAAHDAYRHAAQVAIKALRGDQ